MKILIAPDKFKGSLSALEVCNAVEEGILNNLPESQITKIPLADGGEGSLSVLENTIKFNRIYLEVNDPLFLPIKVFYGLLNNTAYIEMASASGLQLLDEVDRNPLKTTSFGTGQIILDAIQKGATKILLFIGGSATNDCGIGIATALGYKFYDEINNELKPIGENLNKIKSIDKNLAVSFDEIEISVLTDVNNVLYGEKGAANIYAKQKGANENEIEELDDGLKNIAKIIESTFKVDVSKISGSGAAGGVGAGAVAFCNANIKSGIDEIMSLLDLENQIRESDLVITGEGKLDKQTLQGKVVKGVINICQKFNKPIGIVCGDLDLSEKELKQLFPSIIKPIKVNGITKEDAVKKAKYYLTKRANELIRDYSKYSI